MAVRTTLDHIVYLNLLYGNLSEEISGWTLNRLLRLEAKYSPLAFAYSMYRFGLIPLFKVPRNARK